MKPLCYFLCAFLCISGARAYVVDKDGNGYVMGWKPGAIPMRIMLPAPTVTITDGSTYVGSVQTAMAAWNVRLGVVQFTSQQLSPGSYASGNSLNEIVMDSQYNSGSTRKDFGANTLAITVTFTQGNSRVESDVVFNTAYNWNSYRGNLVNGQQDIQRVAIHELGHTLGLGHPDEAVPAQVGSAIMRSNISNLDTMQADDIAGVQLLYGVPGVVPPNDNFANATTINLTGGTTQQTGTNIAATKQTGEPSHAGANAPQGHSVWWKWTASTNGSTTITTLGSNFDTVLAIYTGTTVNALSLIASNDDVQSGVIRTSTITFQAISGTTYAIAVDGWGSPAQGDQLTYTGAITLNLTAPGVGVGTAPSITSQPSSQVVIAGQTAVFSVTASGTPAPSYQWRKNGVNIPNAVSASYSITSVTVGDAGTYTVTVSNSAGSVNSTAASLNVVSAPSSAIITITVE